MLVDSEPISNGVLAEMLTEQGLSMTMTQAKAIYQGLRLEEVLERTTACFGRTLPEGWLEEYQRRRAAAFDAELEPVPGAADSIRALVAGGLSICVASQGALEKTRRSLELTGLDGFFAESQRFSADQVPRGKPDPDLFLFAAASLSFAPAECVVVEDTALGVAAARSAEMRVFGYAGETAAETLEGAGAEVITSLGELVGLLT